GWQEIIAVKDFVIRPEKKLCPNDPPYSLWATYDGPFKEDPLFYSTDVGLPTSSNEFKFIDQFLTEKLSEKLRALLSSEMQFSDEYEAVVYGIQASNCDRLIHVKKKVVSPDDSGL